MTRPEALPRPAKLRSRRRFVASACVLCGVAGTVASLPALAAALPATRSLRFVHTHTGEALTARYAEGGAYDVAALGAINHLLRDFRTGESHAIDPALLDFLYELQVLADRDAPYEVISAYRSPRTNELLRSHSSGVA